ncbi:MAG: nitrate- and nitrite sensing domain-containing protein [Campylobacterota bacterium]|nr:nitrate- and nitrite sensing domain-containing protein [Campylobacterota bacterium]
MFKNISIKSKLLLLVAIPLIALFIIMGELFYKDFKSLNSFKNLQSTVILSTKISEIIHETQKERGMTAGFLSSKGKLFSTKLPNQRTNTNKKVQNLKNYLQEIDLDQIDTTVATQINKALVSLSKIQEVRSRVSQLSINPKEAISYYTNMNSEFLISIIEVSKLSKSPKITQQLVSYVNFLLSKERAGIERAVGTGVLSKNSICNASKIKFTTLIAEQNSYMKTFLQYSSKDSLRYYKETLHGRSIDEVNRIREKILTTNSDSGFGESPQYWFDTISKKINLLKNIDDKISKELIVTIDQKVADVKNELIFTIVLNFVFIILSLYIVMVITKQIVGNIDIFQKGLLDFFKYLNHETTTVKEIKIDTTDELAMMIDEVNKNITYLKDTLENDKNLIYEAEQVMHRVSNGWYSQKILSSTPNKSLNQLKENINIMLDNTKSRFIIINSVLEEYTEHNYLKSLKLDAIEKNGVLDRLEQDINSLQQTITQMLVGNKANGTILDTTSEKLLQNVYILNQNSNEAAAALEQTAASLDEITSNIVNNNNNVVQMSDYASKVTSSAINGEKLANDTTNAMDDINNEVNAINDAIGVIDQIAFQTNILSLNAAVEAATAGEAGKGFAVVAQEVRNLASRSADAANEIKSLVGNAKNKANNGKNIANKMIDGYLTLNKSISKTQELISGVEMASKEQQIGIHQINDAINSLDKKTQENASIASVTHNIAIETNKIASKIVSDTNSKEFIEN